MYCPNCAAENKADTKFCRSCGANLSLVPQALTGQLPDTDSTRRRARKRHRNQPSMSDGISKIFGGLGLLLAAFGVMLFVPSGRIWWFWMLIPAFASLGKGISEIVAAKYEQDKIAEPPPTAIPPVHRPAVPPRRDTGELLPPPSVTEHTTRQLDPSRSKEAQ